jgi:ParB family chromosome partitioning protein
MKLPEGKSRLDLVREGLVNSGLAKRGRLVVSLNRLREDPHNERKSFRNMEGLIASVREHGIVEPITVTSDGDTFLILTGHRRFRAAREAGLAEVEVLIRDPESESLRRMKSLISNVQRENLSALEMAEALQSLLDEDPTIGSYSELGRRIGKSRQWVGEMLNILTLPNPLQQKVRTSGAALSYDSVSKIARLSDVKEQGTLIEAALKGETVRGIREKTREARQRKPAGDGRTLRTKRVQESLDGYTAIVSGPVSPESELRMRAVVEALMERLSQGLN